MDPWSQAGAVKDNSKYAPLTMDRYITGLVRQRSPLRDASVPYLQAKYYQAGRFDSLWDGRNVEINSKSNLGRRPGSVVYNSQTFNAIGRYEDHRVVVDGVSSVHVMVDEALAVYDGTGPSNRHLIWAKSTGAGKTFFMSVGNTLYMSDGVDQIKWTVPAKAWHASTLYNQGDTILDSNNNIQMAFGAASAQVVSSSITAHAHGAGFPVTEVDIDITFSSAVPWTALDTVTFLNLTAASLLNGLTLPLAGAGGSSIRITLPAGQIATYATTTDTGTVYSEGDTGLSGTTGSTQPTWGTGFSQPVTDGSIVWINKGSSVQSWGLVAPTTAPTLTQIPLTGNHSSWAANTFYFTQQIVANPTNTVLSRLFQPGTTGASPPAVWNPTVGKTTVDGTAAWITLATGAPLPANDWAASSAVQEGTYIYYTVAGVQYVFLCLFDGTTGASTPPFTATLGSQVNDNDTAWQNLGVLLNYTSIAASQKIEIAQTIIDPAGYAQNLEISGISGGAAPAWNDTTTGGLTTDGTATWINGGPVAVAATGTVLYAYAGRSSVDGSVSNASPTSIPILIRANTNVLLQGLSPSDPQQDTIVIYRTARGGSDLLEFDEIPSPGLDQVFSYLDTSVDGDLNILDLAAINQQNNPPPVGLSAMAYHKSRIWGAVNGIVYRSAGPDVGGNGNGNTAWSPGDFFEYPNDVRRLAPVTIPNGGLLVFSVADIYAIFGDGTAGNPFTDDLYGKGIGLLNYDAFDMVGATIHMQSTAKKQISLDPSAGYIETGQPIGDQFKKVTTAGFNAPLFTPETTYCTWHESESGDTGLIVADGFYGFFRYSPISAPETGFLWSPFAVIEGGTSAIQSVETSPGHKQLLIGPQTSGPILARDTSVNTDNGAVYSNTYAVIGSIQLCQPYEICEVAGVVLDHTNAGTGPTIGLMFGEVYSGTAGPQFTKYSRTTNDPPLLPISSSIPGDRFVMMQRGGQCPKHRHLQMLIQFAAQDAADEILTHTFYGSVALERKTT